MKVFTIPAGQIKPVVVGHGSCIATDRITVDGSLIGYCCREEPDDEFDSGWRFFAGDEDHAYLENPDNMEVYDVNTIANYDPQVSLILEEAVGSAFERKGGVFVSVA